MRVHTQHAVLYERMCFFPFVAGYPSLNDLKKFEAMTISREFSFFIYHLVAHAELLVAILRVRTQERVIRGPKGNIRT